jgi:hypothetical protein
MLGIGLALVLAGAAPATAVQASPATGDTVVTGSTGQHKIRKLAVRGEAIPIEGAPGSYRVTGGLVGTYVIRDEIELDRSATLVVTAGHEYLNGCVNLNHNKRCDRHDVNGQLQYDYIYWYSQTRDNPPAFSAGDCTHPIVGGTHGFAGARGVLYMHDEAIGDEIKSTYRGFVILNADPLEGDRPLRELVISSSKASISARQGC